MYIKRVTIENVKSFEGRHTFDLAQGVNYLVGDNNSGKSTVLEALLFLFEGPSTTRWTPEKFYCTTATAPTRVEVDIAGGIDELVGDEKFKVLKPFVFEDDGVRILRLERSSNQRTVLQGTKMKDVDVRAVCFWHPTNQQFENTTGIDAKVKALFDFEAVWADAHPSDHIDFASNKTLGRLLDASFKRFVTTEHWESLARAHELAFAPGNEGSFYGETQRLAAGLQTLVEEQYGRADFRFDFGLPDASVFMKQGRLHVDDGAGETPIDGKGSGMQRAITLGLIQLYARSLSSTVDSDTSPLILMLDEPETWLHPSAQLKLGDALNRIGEHDQVFVVTHSPYLIRTFVPRRHLLTVLTGQGAKRQVNPSTRLGLFGQGRPTWGEINYRAFQVNSVEFHNELYGHVLRNLEENAQGARIREEDLDQHFVNHGLERSKTWSRMPGPKAHRRTLPVYIRNWIHHPENPSNLAPTSDELEQSVSWMVRHVEMLNAGADEPAS